MSDQLVGATVGEIAAKDFRTAAIFEQFGIDFCCGGRRSIAEASRAAGADPDQVIRALEALPPRSGHEDDVTEWRADRLIDHIVSTHHAYLRSAFPAIGRHLAKLVDVHGQRHPELVRVQRLFDDVRVELEQHMLKEEHVLFPYVRDLATKAADVIGPSGSPFGTVENPIRMMEREHRDAADAMAGIRDLTQGYVRPADGCATYAVCMTELAEFERDLHRHVHLENNVLFPAALDLEAAACGS